jgi:hypothetical protein
MGLLRQVLASRARRVRAAHDPMGRLTHQATSCRVALGALLAATRVRRYSIRDGVVLILVSNRFRPLTRSPEFNNQLSHCLSPKILILIRFSDFLTLKVVDRNFPVLRRKANSIARSSFFHVCTCGLGERWSHFLRQPVKVDSPIQRTNHHEDAETVFG